MPEPNGKLTPGEAQAALAWLNSRWTNKACPFHGPTNWELGDDLIMTQPFSGIGGGLILGGPTYPLIVVTCGLCGYTVLVNAIKAGIVQVPTPPPPQPASNT